MRTRQVKRTIDNHGYYVNRYEDHDTYHTNSNPTKQQRLSSESTIHNSSLCVISGGQNGTDRAALEAAHYLGMKTGGWAPRGFLTCAGKKPELGYAFKLREIPIGE